MDNKIIIIAEEIYKGYTQWWDQTPSNQQKNHKEFKNLTKKEQDFFINLVKNIINKNESSINISSKRYSLYVGSHWKEITHRIDFIPQFIQCLHGSIYIKFGKKNKSIIELIAYDIPMYELPCNFKDIKIYAKSSIPKSEAVVGISSGPA